MALRMLRPTLATLDTRSAKPAPKTADPFYSSAAWKALVAAEIARRFGGRAYTKCEDPQCTTPDRRGCRVLGDHIVERRDGGAELDPSNILFRCPRCHGRKTEMARAARMARPVGGGR